MGKPDICDECDNDGYSFKNKNKARTAQSIATQCYTRSIRIVGDIGPLACLHAQHVGTDS